MKVFNTSLLLLFIYLTSACSDKKGKQNQESEQIKNVKTTENIQEEKRTTYYKNSGTVHTQGKLVNGKRQGRWISYFESGDLWTENFYVRDTLNGSTTNYYQNGKIKYYGQYIMGERTGVWSFYEEDGKEIKKIDYGNLSQEE